MDTIFYWLFAMLVFIGMIGSFAFSLSNGGTVPHYLLGFLLTIVLSSLLIFKKEIYEVKGIRYSEDMYY